MTSHDVGAPIRSPEGTVACQIADQVVELPPFMGVLKHPDREQLRALVADPDVARKYTREAHRRLLGSALRRFPRTWLVACLDDAPLTDGRRRALRFMLAA